MGPVLSLTKTGRLIDEVIQGLRLSRVRLRRSYYPVRILTDRYEIRTAQSLREILATVRLRYECFFEEALESKAFNLDLDRFDFACDHLIVEDRELKEVVACMRLLPSHKAKEFYATSEFDLGNFMEGDERRIEIGRACIAQTHRMGTVIDLLWKGVIHYARQAKATQAFGLCSIGLGSVGEIPGFHRKVLESGHYSPDDNIRPHYKNQVAQGLLSEDAPGDVRLPPLMRWYMKLGASFVAGPAYDGEIGCIDYLTVLNFKDMHPLYRRRYFGNQAQTNELSG